MCGITGYSTKKGIKLSPTKIKIRANIAKALLIANESRGIDSTGVFLLNGKDHVLSKNTCYASKFVREKEVIKFFEKDNYLMLGHTRQATTGTITKQNAHPFIKGNIIGVHNGILYNHEDLATEHKFKIEVDSEIIFELLNKYENNFIATFKEIRGSASVAWIDKTNPQALYLVAHENPLSVAEVPILETIFFTSEFVSLDSVLQASVGTENYRVWQAEEDVVYQINSDHTIKQTKVSFTSWSNNWSKYNFKNYNNYNKNDKDNPYYDPDDDFLDDKDDKEKKIDSAELEYLQQVGKTKGCMVCHKPLLTNCYWNEFVDDQIYCLLCVTEFELEDFLLINLKTGEYTI